MMRKRFRSYAGNADSESRRWATRSAVLALLLALALLRPGIAEDDGADLWEEKDQSGAGSDADGGEADGEELPAETADDAVFLPSQSPDVSGESPACPEGQQYNQLADGRVVCGPACGPDASPTADGSCRCLRAGATFDPATGTCGCPAGQVDVSRPGERMQCRAACPQGQKFNQLPDGRLVCGPA
jgi:hypothetical protein